MYPIDFSYKWEYMYVSNTVVIILCELFSFV